MVWILFIFLVRKRDSSFSEKRWLGLGGREFGVGVAILSGVWVLIVILFFFFGIRDSYGFRSLGLSLFWSSVIFVFFVR